MMQIPLQQVPSQRLSVVLGSQNVQIAIYQKTTGLYADVNVNGTDVSVGVLALNMTSINACDYAPFVGTLMFVDTQGSSNPVYTGVGSRYQLVYLTESDYAIIQQ